MCDATVLVIDDSPLDRKVFVSAFENAGINALSLGEPLKAVAYVKEHKPDFIILDLTMPGMSGFDVCKQLKIDEETKDIPVIFVSGNEDPNNEDTSIHLGVVDYIPKPASLDYLIQQVIKHDIVNGISQLMQPMKQEMRNFCAKYKDGL